MTGNQSDQSPDQPTAEITDQPMAETRRTPGTAEIPWTPAATAPAPRAQASRPTGAHWPAIVLGLVCVAIAALALGQELGAFTVDWGHLGPLGIVLVGGVLVVVGLLGLLGRRRDDARSDARYQADHDVP
jgi:hypothetical protein